MGAYGITAFEFSGAFDDDIYAETALGNILGLRIFRTPNFLAVDDKGVFLCDNVMVPLPMYRVELGQMSGAVGTALDLVDVNDLEFRPVPSRPQRQASHAPKSVDATRMVMRQLSSRTNSSFC